MPKTFVIGDVHGEFEQLEKVLQLANVNFVEDKVIQIGDLVDRGSEPFKCIDLLLKIFNIVFIRGNHDEEFDKVFLKQGGLHFGGQHGASKTTKAWYALDDQPEKQTLYREFFDKRQVPYHIDEQNRMFVHGGFNRHFPIAEQTDLQFLWDRDLFAAALSYKQMGQGGFDGNKYKFKIKDNFKEVYVGHTPTIYWGKTEPMFAGGGNIINVDTGAGKGGLLTIMDVDTKQFWQA